MRKLLEGLNMEKLIDFLVEYAKADARFANAVNVRFGKAVYEEELDKIEDAIDYALRDVSDYRTHDSWGNAHFYTGDITGEIQQRADQGHIRLAFAEIELLYRKLLELFEYQGECEISQEAEYCIDIMSDIADKAVSDEDKSYIFNQCIGLSGFDEAKNYGADYEDKLLGIAAKFVTKENRDELEQALALYSSNSKWREEGFKLVWLELIKKLDGDTAAEGFIAENLKYQKIREIAFENAMSQKDFTKAEQICVDAISMDDRRYGISPWLYKLYSVYEAEGNVSDMAKTAKKILLKDNFEYYEKLKFHLQNQGKWDDQYLLLLHECANELYHTTYMQVLEKENEYALLLEQLKKHTGQVYRYGKLLASKYPIDICAIFIDAINREAEAAHKRSRYSDVCSHITIFSKTGYEAEALGLVKELIEKYRRKPAFVDELAKI